MATTSTDRRQGVNVGAAVKVPCKAATTANITLSGEQTIDGVSCVDGDRVLVKDQTDTIENGIYEVSTSTWQRTKDWDGQSEVKKGTLVLVHSGTVNGPSFWRVTTADPITIGTTNVSLGLVVNSLAGVSAFMLTLLDETNLANLLSAAGFSSDMQTFLQTANDAAALSALGAAASGDNSDITSLTGITGNVSSTKACAAGYTRVGPNLCMKTAALNESTSVTSLTRDVVTVLTAPSADAKALIVFVSTNACANNAGPNFRHSNVECFGADNGVSNREHSVEARGYEFSAIAAGTALGSNKQLVILRKTTGYSLLFSDDTGNQGTAVYEIRGYFD